MTAESSSKRVSSKKPNKIVFKPISKITKDKLQGNNAPTTSGGKPEIIPVHSLPYSLSPRRNYSNEHKAFKKNLTEMEREFDVDVYWDIDNSPIPKDWQNSSDLLNNVLNSLRTLRKDYNIRTFVGYGDIKKRFSEKQIRILEWQSIKLVEIPTADRLTVAARKNQQDIASAQFFLSTNPSILGQPTSYPDPFLTDPQQIQMAKYFLAQYFRALNPSAWGKTASVYPGSSIADSAQDSQDDNPNGYKEKTDLGDILLIKDMLIGALDNGAPGNILLISTDVDFAKPLLALKKRGFTVLLAEKGNANEKLIESTAASWYWTKMRLGGKFERVMLEEGDKFFTD